MLWSVNKNTAKAQGEKHIIKPLKAFYFKELLRIDPGVKARKGNINFIDIKFMYKILFFAKQL